MSARSLTGPEYDTILAALRLLQNHLDGRMHTVEDVMEIMTSCGEHEPLDADDIDQLIDAMQHGDIQTT